MGEEPLEILKRVRSGQISVEDGAQRLEALESGAGAGGRADEHVEDAQPGARYEPSADDIANEIGADLGWWGQAWQIPFWTGTAVLALSAVLMGWAYSSSHNFWFYCLWLPMLFGVLVVMLGLWSRRARWVHVRVNDASGKRVSISLPLPLRFTSWVLRVFGPMIPSIREKHLDDLPTVLDALEHTDGPISVDVDDKNGDKVKVYIL